jgi:glycosyltransferase involved in cell wall biosynthesis
MQPGVSIILPVYNGARYLENALATVTAQTFTNWELIVVDDGSTDATEKILAQAPPEPRRTVIHQKNTGLAGARNRGLAESGADLVAFLDVDDEWHPSYLSQMQAALAAAPEAAAAFSGWQYLDEAGQRLPQSVLLGPEQIKRLDQEMTWRNAILPSALIARRQAILQAGGFDEDLKAVEDWDLWLRLKALGPFVGVPKVLMGYRTHSASMTENVANIERERLKVNAKHLGALVGPISSWPLARRRAVGHTYFNAALGYFRQTDITLGREKLRQAVECWPDLLSADEFYYELGCAFQPRGLRGTPAQLELAASEDLIHFALSAWPDPGPPGLSRDGAWGQASLNLARLALISGQPRAARRYARSAMRYGRARHRWGGLRAWLRSFRPRRKLSDAGPL